MLLAVLVIYALSLTSGWKDQTQSSA